jgi:ABC-2 type transport system ATP-binding protein
MITAQHLHKSFGLLLAVNDLSLHISAGEIYGLVGSDGAGKTTTLRLLVGALKADAGQISICGYDVNRQGEQARANIGYLSQRFSLYEDLTVLENIRFFAELRGLKRDEWLPRCLEILDFVGLAEFKGRRAGQLSGGMKQKLGLASALVTRPKVLLLDEPTTGVDPVTRQDFWQLIIRIVSGQEMAVLLTTPYMDEASRCHRVGFMRGGRILAEGSPSELRAALDGRIIEVRGRSLPEMRRALLQMEGVEDARAFGDKLHLRAAPARAESVLSALADAFPARSGPPLKARLVPPTLEDVFLALEN